MKTQQRTVFSPPPLPPSQKVVNPRVIPTTSNPSITVANAGSRIISNSSFESQLTSGDLCESVLGGWQTSHPGVGEGGCRILEVWTKNNGHDSLLGIGAPSGTYYIELNASVPLMAYQPICVVNGESFTFEFYHHIRAWSDTNIVELRFGIPSGLDSGSRAADSYSRQIMRGASVQGANGSIATASVTSYLGTFGVASAVQGNPLKNWVKYTGSYMVPADSVASETLDSTVFCPPVARVIYSTQVQSV
jgi:hypothetical protein